LISFRLTFSCLLKDQAVAASRHDATLNNEAPSYTTSVDSTGLQGTLIMIAPSEHDQGHHAARKIDAAQPVAVQKP
jgi:hypothetical protein